MLCGARFTEAVIQLHNLDLVLLEKIDDVVDLVEVLLDLFELAIRLEVLLIVVIQVLVQKLYLGGLVV